MVFCNRTLNFRSIRAVGYDMDYTLIHYKEAEWERRAYQHLKQRLAARGWPTAGLEFDPAMVCRGLVIDTERGNLVKANRFGFVKRAMHGTRVLGFEEQRQAYARVIMDLSDPRWVFLNTLFSLSEGCMYAQLVDLLDQRGVPEVLGYAGLYQRIRETLDRAHMEGALKAEIMADPDRFVTLDPETALTLLDQFHAGKRLLLITNAEWDYTTRMMAYAFDRYLPKGMGWRDLFELVVAGARKPHFFTEASPFFEVATADGLLRPGTGRLARGGAYYGGSASLVERHLGLAGDEILYVGDHMFGDVHVTKNVLRWRTALILQELDQDLSAAARFRGNEQRLGALMTEKERLEEEAARVRLALQRARRKYGPPAKDGEAALQKRGEELRGAVEKADAVIAPLARASSGLSNSQWGLLMRAGNDKSYLAFQVERYADIYTSRVSNLLSATPFAYLRAPRGTLPHDEYQTVEQATLKEAQEQ